MTSETRSGRHECVRKPSGLPQVAFCGQREIPMIETSPAESRQSTDVGQARSAGRASSILGKDPSSDAAVRGGHDFQSPSAQRCRSLQSGVSIDCSRNQDDHPGAIGRQSRLTDIRLRWPCPSFDTLTRSSARASAASTPSGWLAQRPRRPTVDPGTSLGWPVRRSTDDAYGSDERDEILGGMDRHDIAVASPWTPPPLIPQVAERSDVRHDGWPVAEFVSQRTIALPMFGGLTDREVGLVTQTLELMMQRTTFRRS